MAAKVLKTEKLVNLYCDKSYLGYALEGWNLKKNLSTGSYPLEECEIQNL